MAMKILTKNSIENTNIDGARNNYFNSGMRSGIVKGAFGEGKFFNPSSNSIALDPCELVISGHRIVIDSTEVRTLTNKPKEATRYSLIAEIVVDDSSNPTFKLYVQQSILDLVKDNLFKTNVGNGKYQVEIGQFTLNPNGTITDIKRTAEVITGGNSYPVFTIEGNTLTITL